MAKKNYTQTVKPVSRIPEKIFGWLAWIALLAITVLLLFFALVTMNDAQFTQNMTQQLETQFQDLAEQGQDIGAAPGDLADMVVGWLNNVWMIALYLMIPLILGLFGLLTMRRRILAGFLLLVAAIFTAPLIAPVVTGIIPLFFIIAAILLFVRKDRVIRNDDVQPIDEDRRYDRDHARKFEDDRVTENRAPSREARRGDELSADQSFDYNRPTAHRQDDAPLDRDEVNEDKGNRAPRNHRDDDIESTRTFSLDEYDDENRTSSRDTMRRSDETPEDDRFVDRNIDSSEPVTPVSEEEYTRRGGTAGSGGSDDRADDMQSNDASQRRTGDDYSYDATKERRDNVNRRNNDSL
ncbi:hypothetical protein GCM10022378_05130 [Salinicoccus jeotgali]|uniref:DUF4064 domain-containing protein n=1 Tax=Salinicoccus jeotgali TaxID=381634 RepID=A0ABP7EJ36_9STAP